MYRVIYDSDLIIRDSSTLATLCIFYDVVSLPFLPPDAVHKFVRIWRSTGRDGEAYFDFDQIDTEDLGDYHLEWEQKVRPLYEAGVLERLPPVKGTLHFKDSNELASALESLSANMTFGPPNGKAYLRSFYIARVFHHLRDDLSSPRLFELDAGTDNRELFKILQAQQLFTYFLPAIQSIEPEQILEVRDKVRDNREGFAMHLQKLSKEVERRAQGGESLEELSKYAKSVVETELIPDYLEFKRQLASERGGFWVKVLDRASKIFEVEAPITSPKFWGELMAAVGLPVASSLERRRDSLTNRQLTFNFLRAAQKQLEGEQERGGS